MRRPRSVAVCKGGTMMSSTPLSESMTGSFYSPATIPASMAPKNNCSKRRRFTPDVWILQWRHKWPKLIFFIENLSCLWRKTGSKADSDGVLSHTHPLNAARFSLGLDWSGVMEAHMSPDLDSDESQSIPKDTSLSKMHGRRSANSQEKNGEYFISRKSLWTRFF